MHSIYFEMLGEHGFVGLLLFLALIVFTWRKCGSIIRIAKKDAKHAWSGDLAAMIQVSLVGYTVGGAFLGLAYFDYFYHLVALAVVTYALVNKPLPVQRAAKTVSMRDSDMVMGPRTGSL